MLRQRSSKTSGFESQTLAIQSPHVLTEAGDEWCTSASSRPGTPRMPRGRQVDWAHRVCQPSPTERPRRSCWKLIIPRQALQRGSKTPSKTQVKLEPQYAEPLLTSPAITTSARTKDMQVTPSDRDIVANTALANEMTNAQINWASMHSVPAHAPTTPLPARYVTVTAASSGLDIHSPKTHMHSARTDTQAGATRQPQTSQLATSHGATTLTARRLDILQSTSASNISSIYHPPTPSATINKPITSVAAQAHIASSKALPKGGEGSSGGGSGVRERGGRGVKYHPAHATPLLGGPCMTATCFMPTVMAARHRQEAIRQLTLQHGIHLDAMTCHQ